MGEHRFYTAGAGVRFPHWVPKHAPIVKLDITRVYETRITGSNPVRGTKF